MLVPISLPPGLNSDDTAFSAEGKWAEGINVRFHNGKPQVKGGEEELFTIDLVGTCLSILPFRRTGAISIAYGMEAALYVGSGLSAPSDRTPSGLGVLENWALAPWGDTLLAVPEGGRLYQQSGSGVATSVTAAPDAIIHMLVTAQRQVLALGCNEEESGVFNALCVRWSDLENYSSWTTTPTNNVGEHILESGGAIVAGRQIGSYVAIWTTSALFLAQFIGDPGQTYRFDKIDDNCGLVGPNAVVVHGQRAYWVGPDLRVRTWTPGEQPQILPCPISQDLTERLGLGTTRYITVSANTRFNEIRIDFPGGGFDNPYPLSGNSQYIAITLDSGAWHQGNGARMAIVDSALLSSLTTGYAGNPTIITASDANPTIIRLHETGTFEWEGGAAAAQAPYIQSGSFCLDNSQRRMMVRSVHPDFEDQSGDVALTLFARDHPQSNQVTKGPYTLTTATMKEDFRASGKIFAIRIGAPSGAASLYFRLGKPLFDVVPMGER